MGYVVVIGGKLAGVGFKLHSMGWTGRAQRESATLFLALATDRFQYAGLEAQLGPPPTSLLVVLRQRLHQLAVQVEVDDRTFL